jgi:hypothetical protein
MMIFYCLLSGLKEMFKHIISSMAFQQFQLKVLDGAERCRRKKQS